MEDTARVSSCLDGTEPLLFPDSSPLSYLGQRDGKQVFSGHGDLNLRLLPRWEEDVVCYPIGPADAINCCPRLEATSSTTTESTSPTSSTIQTPHLTPQKQSKRNVQWILMVLKHVATAPLKKVLFSI